MAGSGFLKQSTSATVLIGPFLDDADGKTAQTGLTISQSDVLLSKNGGALAQKNDTNSATHDASGYYACALNSTDTGTLGRLRLCVSEAGALPVWHTFTVLPANVYDSIIGGSDNLQVDTVQVNGTAQTSGDLAALITAVDDYVDSEVAAIKAVTDKLDTALENDGGVYRYTTNALEQAPSGGGGGGGSAISHYFGGVLRYSSTSRILPVYIENDSTGEGLTGLAYNATGFHCYYMREDQGNAGGTSVTLATAARGTFTSGGWVEKDSTNLPGWYEFGLPNAAVSAATSRHLVLVFKGATGMKETHIHFTIFYMPTDSATPAADLRAIMGTSLTESAGGRLKAAWTTFFDVASPVLTTASVNQTGDSYARIGANGASLSAVPWNNAGWDAEVQSEVQDAIEANHLDHLLAQTYDPASKPGAADALLNELIGNDAGVSQFTANALELGPGGAGVWASAGADITGTPAATDSYGEKIDWIYAKLSFEQDQTKTLQTVANEAGTIISEATVSSDGTTVTRGKFADA